MFADGSIVVFFFYDILDFTVLLLANTQKTFSFIGKLFNFEILSHIYYFLFLSPTLNVIAEDPTFTSILTKE